MTIQETSDVVVVGGGVIGCAAAHALSEAGQRVTLIERLAVGHAEGSSHGPSRIIRLAYDGEDYVHLARRSFELWRELEATTGASLLTRVGGLDVGSADALAMDGIRQTYDATGVEYELLDRAELAYRFPQFNFPEESVALFQPDYSLLAADRCVATLARRARELGASIREHERVVDVRPDGDGVEVETSLGRYHASRVVIASGSWIAPMLRALGLEIPLRVLKEQLAFFSARQPEEFVPGRLPLAIHRFQGTTSLGSVFPIFDHAGVKIMIDRIGPEVDPENSDRTIDQASLDRLRSYALELLPGLTGEIIEAVSCRYTMTPDEDFVIDRHPIHPQIVIASACSGHGFKFAVAIGKALADLAIAGTTTLPISRFRLDRPALTGSV